MNLALLEEKNLSQRLETKWNPINVRLEIKMDFLGENQNGKKPV